MSAMTYAALHCRFMQLTMQKSDLEYAILQITSTRQRIAFQIVALSGEDFNDNPAIDQLQLTDQIYELEQTNLETQQKAVSAEYDSVSKLLDNNIKKDNKIDAS